MFKEFSYIVVVHAEGNHYNHIQSIFKNEDVITYCMVFLKKYKLVSLI